jgi:hypothetical protein
MWVKKGLSETKDNISKQIASLQTLYNHMSKQKA